MSNSNAQRNIDPDAWLLDPVNAEELLSLISDLTNRYTSMESSSVTYETAQMLMQAVLYTLEHAMDSLSDVPGTPDQKLPLKQLYERGREVIGEKAQKTMRQYEQLTFSFESYGCRNYYDTVMKGLPAFFSRYDIRFQPHNTILMLDYPTMVPDPSLCGIDRIHDYLTKISLENEFLARFPHSAVTDLLRHSCLEYEELYLDNICELVLRTAIGCVLLHKPVAKLSLDVNDRRQLQRLFASFSTEQAHLFVCDIIKQLLVVADLLEAAEYFLRAGRDIAVRQT